MRLDCDGTSGGQKEGSKEDLAGGTVGAGAHPHPQEEEEDAGEDRRRVGLI